MLVRVPRLPLAAGYLRHKFWQSDGDDGPKSLKHEPWNLLEWFKF